MNKPALIERALTALALIALLAAAGWFVKSTFQAVPVPPSTYVKGAVRFRADLDVSKQDAFFRLRPLGPTEVTIPPAGRPDPFQPVVISTSTASTTTSTVPERP